MSSAISRYLKLEPIYPPPLVLYKHLLRHSKYFFDDATQYYFIKQARHLFRKHRHVKDKELLNTYLDDAFTHLKRLVRANKGSRQDVMILIGITYGFIGPIVNTRRTHLMNLQFKPEKIIYNRPDFCEIKWGVEADERNYPFHPRVMLTMNPDPSEFMKELIKSTALLPPRQRRIYRHWPELAWLPNEAVHFIDENVGDIFEPLEVQNMDFNEDGQLNLRIIKEDIESAPRPPSIKLI